MKSSFPGINIFVFCLSLQVFSLLMAAAVHDLAHPGLTNDFLVRSGHPLVSRPGDGGVNERHHVATFLQTLRQDGSYAFTRLTADERQQVWNRKAALVH